MKRFLLILQFMTRVPVNKSFDVTVDDFRKGVRYFPIIGLVVGMVVAMSIYISSLGFSICLSGFIGALAYVVITGGLHLDGFSDTCDGIFSGRKKEKILEIMSDSRLGTFGGVGLIMLLAFRIILYIEVLSLGDITRVLPILVLSPIVARGIVTYYMYNRRYAKENSGLGDLFIGKISKKEIILNQLLVLFLGIILWWKFIFVYPIVLFIMILIRNKIESVLNGLTGDILGFAIELSEIVFLFISIGGINIWNLYL
ncbi:MAG: adenosylcobinamide-GDP ribazoletransferase [Clostridium sp.]